LQSPSLRVRHGEPPSGRNPRRDRAHTGRVRDSTSCTGIAPGNNSTTGFPVRSHHLSGC
jgi:hypothetical protein